MTVLILESVSPSLRGMISRWLIEVKAGVFVGKVNALVRKLLWEKCTENLGDGSIILLWATNNEQGLDILHQNLKDYIPTDMEGIFLTLHPKK